MAMVYKDKAHNKLFIGAKSIYARNASGRLINRRGVMTMLRKANRAGKVKMRR